MAEDRKLLILEKAVKSKRLDIGLEDPLQIHTAILVGDFSHISTHLIKISQLWKQLGVLFPIYIYGKYTCKYNMFQTNNQPIKSLNILNKNGVFMT